jgi:hypothetical protein
VIRQVNGITEALGTFRVAVLVSYVVDFIQSEAMLGAQLPGFDNRAFDFETEDVK